jgi:hypothetical protein
MDNQKKTVYAWVMYDWPLKYFQAEASLTEVLSLFSQNNFLGEE